MMNSFSQKSENKPITTAHSIQQQNQPPCPLLVPYGAIPKYKKDKRRRKALSSQKFNHNLEHPPSVLAPYPFFQLALSSSPSFLTSLAHKWFIHPTLKKKTTKLAALAENEKHSTVSPVGFMPRTLPPTTDMAYLSSLKVSAPMDIHNHAHDHQQDASSSLSSFSSSSSSSLEDTCSFNTNDSWNDSSILAKETDYSTSSHYYNSTNSKTASTLSGLLCEHYVQSQLMIMTMMDYDASDDADVENDADGCPVTCPSLTPTSTSNTSASSTSSSTSTTDTSLLDTLIYPFSSSPCTFDNKIFDTTTTDPSATILSSTVSTASNNKDSPNETTPIDVPLSTFRMFRARDDENDNDKENIVWNESISLCNEYDDTMGNDRCFGSCDNDNHSQCDEKKNRTNGTIPTITEEMHQHQNDIVYSGKEALLENSWANWQKAWQGKQWVLSMSEQDEKKDDCLPRTSDQRIVTNPNPTPSSVPPSPPPPIALNKSREPRVNSAHLRMLVAEVNMMRADKIVGPLRPRNYLPKRNDPIPSSHCRLTPSPLSFNFVSE
ncbi:hypothetical protein BCR42DRAFT_417178 [Absidia repens]|uniref:Uncharacterized protein n=1 Tax=Absidia repens TaxID=90262 RepID=A0A1X2IDG8_9FUNG|nr:hypothetical protein BCR42DRAFT_417178 [Absidia repens]